MFTIKHITKYGEMLWEGFDVVYEAAGRDSDKNVCAPTKAKFSFATPDVPRFTIDSGDVYVMNSAGNTVSKYHLDNSVSPQ